MTDERKAYWAPGVFGAVCELGSYIAVVMLCIGAMVAISGAVERSDVGYVGLSIIIESFKGWFICRLAIVILQIRDKHGDQATRN